MSCWKRPHLDLQGTTDARVGSRFQHENRRRRFQVFQTAVKRAHAQLMNDRTFGLLSAGAG